MMMQGRTRGLRELCRLLGYTPQAYYQYQRKWQAQTFREELLIQQVLAHRRLQPRLGTRKLLVMLQPFMAEHDMLMGRDAFFELLEANNLLIRKRRRNKPQTTFSGHWYKKYPDLNKGFTPARANELWVSDITYIRLSGRGFAYLSLVTDAYSRKITGFCLHADLGAEGPLKALDMALNGRTGLHPLIHHSDRGIQYCCGDYVNKLLHNGIAISMTQSGDPRDNAIAERVNGILKQELLKNVYPGIRLARQELTVAIDTYNRLRPHSSVDMMTPEKAHAQNGPISRRWKNAFKTTKSSQQKKEVL